MEGSRLGSSRANCTCLFFFQAEDGIRDATVTGVQTCALPICSPEWPRTRFREVGEVVGLGVKDARDKHLALVHAQATDDGIVRSGSPKWGAAVDGDRKSVV